MPKKEVKLEETSPEVAETQEATPEVDTVTSEETPKEEPTEDALTEEPTEEVNDAAEPEISVGPAETAEPENPSSDIGTDKTVTVQSVKFASFEDQGQTPGETNKNLEILMDIKLQMTVELGRTELPIKKVLELTRGSIIELEKLRENQSSSTQTVNW